MLLKLLLWMQWTSVCSSLSSLTTCTISHNSESNRVSIDCKGRGLTEIPRDFPVNTTSIDLSNNQIGSVPDHIFLDVPKLQALDLSSNVISIIEPLAFWNCRSLSYLNIQFNRVCVNGNVFQDIGNLQQLGIDDCYAAEVLKPLSGVTTISIQVNQKCSFEGFHYLTNLRKLVIDGILICQNDTFSKLNGLNIQQLRIGANIPHMEKNTLAPFKQLEHLVFCYTETGLLKPLDALYALVGRNITTLVLDTVRNGGVSQNLKDVEDRTLTKESLKYLSKICVENLSAQNNRILFIDLEFLTNAPIAKCLRSLKLGRNMITHVQTQVYLQLWKVRQLEYLNIADQARLPVTQSKVPKTLITSNNSEQNSRVDSGLIITFPEYLTELNFSRLETAMGHLDFDINIRNGYRSKKVDFSFNGLTALKNIYGVPNLEFIDLSGNVGLRLPDTFFCPFNRTETLRLTDMSLTQTVLNVQGEMFLRCLPRLKTLDISGNRLVQLPTDLFKLNAKLEYLDLSRNIFVSVPVHLNLLPNLHMLDVSSNSFGSLDKKSTEDIDNHYMKTNTNFQLHLEGNFFECSCTNVHFIYWLSETEVLADTKSDLVCITENGNFTETREITQNMLKFWRKCEGSETFSTSSVLGTLLLCCILVVLLIDTNKTRFAYFMINALKFQVPKRRRKDFQRDVYISYADVDYRWACLELCAVLEERNLNLFIWDRDSVPGDCTPEAITETVDQCWKTILYFTENYERDAWSYLTTMAAVNCRAILTQNV